MWIANKDGFFSIVKKGKMGGYMGTPPSFVQGRPFCVRGRVRKDIQNFMNRIGLNYKILANDATDYEYRIFISEKELAEYMVACAGMVDYDNFKSSCAPMEPERSTAYHGTWAAMFNLGDIDRPNGTVTGRYFGGSKGKKKRKYNARKSLIDIVEQELAIERQHQTVELDLGKTEERLALDIIGGDEEND